MSKKESYEITASQYYIEMQMSISTISKRLDVSEKTLHNWKKSGEWDKKRALFLKSQYSANQKLYELVNLLTTKALEDFKIDGTIPDQKTLYFIMNMADRLDKLKQFEEKTAVEKINEVEKSQDSTQNENLENKNKTDEMLQKFFKAVLGGSV